MRNSKGYIYKIILIVILSICIGWAVVHFICARLAVPRLPDESLQTALDFVENEDYIGMTFEECEAIFGDSGKDSPGQCIVYSVGRFDWMGRREYELHIYFDHDEKVKAAILAEKREV